MDSLPHFVSKSTGGMCRTGTLHVPGAAGRVCKPVHGHTFYSAAFEFALVNESCFVHVYSTCYGVH